MHFAWSIFFDVIVKGQAGFETNKKAVGCFCKNEEYF